MSRTDKLHARLDALEGEFRERLVRNLREVADGRNQLFFAAPESNPFRAVRPYAETAELLALAEEIQRLREKLGESADGLATRLRVYCAKWGDLSDHHRGDARSLATTFLAEIEAVGALR